MPDDSIDGKCNLETGRVEVMRAGCLKANTAWQNVPPGSTMRCRRHRLVLFSFMKSGFQIMYFSVLKNKKAYFIWKKTAKTGEKSATRGTGDKTRKAAPAACGRAPRHLARTLFRSKLQAAVNSGAKLYQ